MDLGEMIAKCVTRPMDERARLIGFMPGVVTDVDSKLCLVKARLLSQEDNEQSDWLIPMFPGAIESVPAKNEKVIVFFQDGDPARGAYVYYPDSKTTGRPTEAMMLATTFAGMYNDLVAKFNNLLSTVHSFILAYNTHVHAAGTLIDHNGGACTGATATTASTATNDNDANAATVQAADGSTPAAIATSKIVLSGVAKVR